MIRTARAFYFTALGLWAGGMAVLAFVVAPTLFRTAPSRGIAGTVFGAVLRNFGPLQIAFGLLSLLAVGVLMKWGDLSLRAGLLRASTLVLMLVLVCAAQFYVGPEIERERAAIPNFDAIPSGVPAKARFDSLHRWSVRLAGVTLIAGVALLAGSAAALKPPDGA